MKVMIIDDDLISRKKLMEILKPRGECEEYERGDVALVAFEKAVKNKEYYSLVTIDINMPHLSGISVLHKIRDIEDEYKLSKDKKVKIMMVTSSNEKEKVSDAMEMGCDDYILKPFDEEVILERLEINNYMTGWEKNKRLKIMVVDDEMISRKKLVESFKDYGDSDEFEKGTDAIQVFRKSVEDKKKYDLITIDINMPDIDGISILHKIRAIEIEQKIPQQQQTKVIMVTSNTDKSKFYEALSLRCDDYILKPFNENLISDRMKTYDIEE
ncbi:MAG: response regulator [Candidatus Margulisbacteria bacterium]|nr:response regulator [Candidatus Margulisiibacteriota bacterium]